MGRTDGARRCIPGRNGYDIGQRQVVVKPQPNQPEHKGSPPLAGLVFNQILDAGRTIVRTSLQTAWNLIYPYVCIHCQRVDSMLCSQCIANILTASDAVPVPDIDDFAVVGQHTGPLRSAIHALKYEGKEYLKYPLGMLLAEQLQQRNWSFSMIIPVPLHLSRQKERGYNQANSIAEALSLHLEGPTVVTDALHRTRNTESQVGKSASDRRENVSDAFVVESRYQDLLSNSNILLIDDVCTTGSTLQASAEVLRAAGVQSVFAATISRAVSLDMT